MKAKLDLIAKYDAANREIAEAILANPEQHRGLAQEWAQLWLANHPGAWRRKKQQPKTATQVTGSRLWEEEAS